MKKIILLSLTALCASCGKTPTNGHLDGQWFMTERYCKANISAPDYSEAMGNLREQPVIWNISLQLMEIITPGFMHNSVTDRTTGRIVYNDDKLAVTQTYVHFRDRDSLITEPNTTCLESVGIRGNSATFRIATLTSSQLTLCSDMDSLIFRKKH